MIARGKIRESDYILFYFLNLRPKPVVIFFQLIIISVGSIGAIMALGLIFWLVCLTGMFLFGFLLHYFQAKRKFRFEPNAPVARLMEIRDDGIFVKAENAENAEGGQVPWSAFLRWKRSKQQVVLYRAGRWLLIIPSHFFGSKVEFDGFSALVQSKPGKASW